MTKASTRSPRAAGQAWRPTPARHARGFTAIELMLAVAILAIVAALAYPSYASYQERGRIAQATIDIKDMEQRIKLYAVDNRAYPETLAEIGKGGLRDPWGNPYEYTNLETAKGKGAARKNKNLVPINSDFDLYSKGKDGASSSPLTAKPSRDDIVRANDGRFVGLASDYEP
jgi:general secretion pathway protein G